MSDAKFEKAIAELNAVRQSAGVNINGKLYSMVKDRVELFRRIWGAEYGINTDINYDRGFSSGQVIVSKASIAHIPSGGVIVASGHAMTFIGFDEVSTTSAVEAVETASIGRALACFGLLGGEFASADEIKAVDYKKAASRQTNVSHETNERTMVNARPPVTKTTGLYIPDITEELLANPHNHVDDVIKIIDSIGDKNILSKYWGEIEEFRKVMSDRVPERVAELKAAFSTAYNNSIANYVTGKN